MHVQKRVNNEIKPNGEIKFQKANQHCCELILNKTNLKKKQAHKKNLRKVAKPPLLTVCMYVHTNIYIYTFTNMGTW